MNIWDAKIPTFDYPFCNCLYNHEPCERKILGGRWRSGRQKSLYLNDYMVFWGVRIILCNISTTMTTYWCVWNLGALNMLLGLVIDWLKPAVFSKSSSDVPEPNRLISMRTTHSDVMAVAPWTSAAWLVLWDALSDSDTADCLGNVCLAAGRFPGIGQ